MISYAKELTRAEVEKLTLAAIRETSTRDRKALETPSQKSLNGRTVNP